MEGLIAPIASGIVSAVTAAFVSYVAVTNRLTRVETMLEHLNSETRKHNNVLERTYKLESDCATMWKRYDELTARVGRMEDICQR